MELIQLKTGTNRHRSGYHFRFARQKFSHFTMSIFGLASTVFASHFIRYRSFSSANTLVGGKPPIPLFF
ncbi:TPA: hypothetical protein ACHHFU_002740, partial [Staphylococcus aureus]